MNTYNAVLILDGSAEAGIEDLAEAVVTAINQRIPLSTGIMVRNFRAVLDLGLIEGKARPVKVNQDMLIEYIEYFETQAPFWNTALGF